MKILKIIKENGREYKFIKKCNNTVYLYEETKYHYKRCFTAFDLKLIKQVVEPPKSYIKPEKVKYL